MPTDGRIYGNVQESKHGEREEVPGVIIAATEYGKRVFAIPFLLYQQNVKARVSVPRRNMSAVLTSPGSISDEAYARKWHQILVVAILASMSQHGGAL